MTRRLRVRLGRCAVSALMSIGAARTGSIQEWTRFVPTLLGCLTGGLRGDQQFLAFRSGRNTGCDPFADP